MSVLIHKDTKVIVQGITGKAARFHTEQMQKYGTNIVGGTAPGRAGEVCCGVPVFNTVRDAVAVTKATTSVIFVPAAFAARRAAARKGAIMAGMNMQQMMKQARKMQEQLAAAQENLKSQTVDASAGGGMVKVTVNGEMELVNLTIDPDALDPEDVDMLQDMIMAAVNEAVRGVNELANKQMGAITGGLNIPGMPF